jgi:hypothetical protein
MEALALGVPVCYSDILSFRQQLGEQAHYIDLNDATSLVRALDAIQEEEPNSSPCLETIHANVDEEYLGILRQIIAAYSAKLIGTNANR